MEWRFVLPITKPLSLNERLHWSQRNARTKVIRDAACVLSRQQEIPPCRRISVQLHFVPARNGRRDPINLMPTSKAVEDGIVDARVVPDDTPEYVMTNVPIIHPADKAFGPKLWVVVEQLS